MLLRQRTPSSYVKWNYINGSIVPLYDCESWRTYFFSVDEFNLHSPEGIIDSFFCMNEFYSENFSRLILCLRYTNSWLKGSYTYLSFVGYWFDPIFIAFSVGKNKHANERKIIRNETKKTQNKRGRLYHCLFAIDPHVWAYFIEIVSITNLFFSVYIYISNRA
jgi:hypothetical protein